MSGDDHFIRPDNDVPRLNSHQQTAFSILSKNPAVLLDDEPLDDLIKDIASALQNAFDLGFNAAGESIYLLPRCKKVLERAEGYFAAAAFREVSEPPYEMTTARKELAEIRWLLADLEKAK